MKKSLILIVVFGLIGLFVGYLLFARVNSEYLSLKLIFGANNNVFQSFGRQISGINEIKQNILISGLVGAILGILIKIFKK